MLLLLVGGGFVGTVTATVFAEAGHDVRLLEADPRRRALLEQGRPPFEEPGVASAFGDQVRAGRLRVVADAATAASDHGFDAAFLCVGTPPAPDGSADLGQIRSAARAVAPHTRILCVKSTVPPGTLEDFVAPIVAEQDLIDPPRLASVPEFLAEGQALHDARNPSRIVVGTHDEVAARMLLDLHAPLGAAVIHTTPRAAEMAKYASNAMLAARVGIVNEIANLCHAVHAPVDQVMRIAGLDPRIGPRFLDAGLGFGGSCFPKDVLALSTLGRRQGSPLPILEEVLRQNDLQPLRVAAMVEQELAPLPGRRIAILGVAFKPETSDARGSRAIVLARDLQAKGATVVVHDPHAVAPDDLPQTAGIVEALTDADACVVATPWPEYVQADWPSLLPRMRRPLIIDPWRRLSHLRAHGARHLALGDPQHESSDPRSGARDAVPALHQERT